ncbi:MAG: HD domain-containing protein [Clostridia bacterium]|nr:HD domain-containing protein [Clostridia bacterium]
MTDQVLPRRKVGWRVGFWVCLGGVLINLLGIIFAKLLHLPLFFDAIGTILAAVSGGYLPGIIVGFATNLVGAVVDQSSVYYGSLNVIIALAAAFMYRRKAFSRIRTSLLAVLVFAFIGGVLGSGLTWMINGFSWAQDNSTVLGDLVRARVNADPFWSQLIANILIDLADKAIAVLIVYLALRFMPAYVTERLPLFGQDPRMKTPREQLRGGMSLRRKAALLISAATVVTAAAAVGISVLLYHSNTISEQTALGEGIAKVEAGLIDPEKVELYLKQGESAEGYAETEEKMEGIRASYPSIQYMYVYQIQSDGCHVVFDLDTEEVEGGKPGEVVGFDDSFMPYLGALMMGKRIDPLITNDSFGWLLTVYEPVYNSEGICVCYAAVDISMGRLVTEEFSFLTKALSLFVGFFILILVISLHVATEGVVLPVNAIASATGSFAYDTEKSRAEVLERIRNLDIHTGDEIENLYHALAKTTEDTVHYITTSQDRAAQVQKLQNGLILVLADLVESRDQCTGDHVRKTAAYVRIIAEQMKRDGSYADKLTDEFIENVTNSAPLHDVGKIKVPDAILNKPGKLTDEEFELMKTHTTEGSEIISHAMDTVDWRSGYLAEARNLAHYHHEKWDGSGYPKGLKGESIPLSARIMAVADVFDALVSRRSYKEPFPVEQALDIIKKGAGAHFDPKVVSAFLNAENEIRQVSSSYITDTYCTIPTPAGGKA